MTIVPNHAEIPIGVATDVKKESDPIGDSKTEESSHADVFTDRNQGIVSKLLKNIKTVFKLEIFFTTQFLEPMFLLVYNRLGIGSDVGLNSVSDGIAPTASVKEETSRDEGQVPNDTGIVGGFMNFGIKNEGNFVSKRFKRTLFFATHFIQIENIFLGTDGRKDADIDAENVGSGGNPRF